MSSGSEGSPGSPRSPTNNSDEESSNESQIYKLIMEVVIPYFFPIRVPRNTSMLRRNDWVGEILHGHDGRVIKALNLLAIEVITPPNFNEIHPKIAEEPDFAFFEDAIGAIDGTLVPAWVPASRRNAYRSRKSHVSQNVLAICDFDLMFTYVYAGWEGSANDALVLRNAIANDPMFPFPPHGKYYLVDAGYTNYMCFLAPYRGCRRHIEEFNRGTRAMTGPNEKRFPILAWGMPSYRINRQVQMVIASCVLHNYIRKFSRDDEIFNKELEPEDVDVDTFYHKGHPSQAMVQAQALFRDGIAHSLWEQYPAS
ncbi:PREDICTED: uncharacterized protein LOC105960048 [Erythranthe guttata]|uniref:uncharacterized protein LOC105960048 n=1 Tax=Erythranthe guttata TaxID=4155 RepID=UPI00064D90E3|nr:PREDICTED: uncharacterized protein LOC105960048 [Erythranthe guttata]|eukprot:XP_012839672.1 PREDICTED: uncharacterized protein LOC105960048 [Erythranthe guttata]